MVEGDVYMRGSNKLLSAIRVLRSLHSILVACKGSREAPLQWNR